MFAHSTTLLPAAVICALSLGVASTATAQQPKGKRRGFLLQVVDARAYVKDGPVVTLKGSLGTLKTVHPKDDGKIPDAKAGDRTYTVSVPSFFDPKVDVTIASGGAKWTAKVELKPDDDRAQVNLELKPDGATELLKPRIMERRPGGADRGPPPPPGKGGKRAPHVPKGTAENLRPEMTWQTKIGVGFAMWVGAFVAFGAAVFVMRRGARREEDEGDADAGESEQDTESTERTEDEQP